MEACQDSSLAYKTFYYLKINHTGMYIVPGTSKYPMWMSFNCGAHTLPACGPTWCTQPYRLPGLGQHFLKGAGTTGFHGDTGMGTLTPPPLGKGEGLMQ